MRRILSLVMLVLPAVAFTLDFSTVVDRLDEVDQVWLAANRIDAARQQVEAAGFAGDVDLSISPSGSLTADATGVRTAEIGGSASLTVPLGLSDDAQQKLEQSETDLAMAAADLQTAREDAWVRLYSLYQAAWLAQEELVVLDAELEVARSAHEVARARFAEGDITVAQLGAAAETLARAQTARDQGTLTHRLAWLDLAFTIGIDPAVQLDLEPHLSFSEDPPKPPELSDWAMVNDRELAERRAALADLERELALEATEVQLASTKLQLSLWDHGVSLSYAPANPSLAASYTPPSIAVYEASSATRETVPFSLTLSGTVTISGSREDELADGLTSVELERARHELASLEDALDVRIRSTYQQMHRATDAVALAERALETAQENLAIVEALAEAGQAGETDVASAHAAVARAEYELVAARIGREEAMIAAVQAASYFSQHYSTAVSAEGESE